jgi:hypothetical protein
VRNVTSTPRDGWRERRDVVMREPSWQFGSVAALEAAQRVSGAAMGLLSLGAVDAVRARRRPASDRAHDERRLTEVRAQGDLFRPEYSFEACA